MCFLCRHKKWKYTVSCSYWCAYIWYTPIISWEKNHFYRIQCINTPHLHTNIACKQSALYLQTTTNSRHLSNSAAIMFVLTSSSSSSLSPLFTELIWYKASRSFVFHSLLDLYFLSPCPDYVYIYSMIMNNFFFI